MSTEPNTIADEEKMPSSLSSSELQNQVPRSYVACRESTLVVIRKGSLGAGTALPWGAFAIALTTFALHHAGWQGDINMPTTVYVGDFLFAGGIGMVVSAQWELAAGNGLSYSMFSAFGLFFASYGVILIPGFGVAEAFHGRMHDYHNALAIFIIVWAVFVLGFLVAALPTNVISIGLFFFLQMAFISTATSHFAFADGHITPAIGLTKASGYFQLLAGLCAWYLTFHHLLRDSFLELPLGDTSRYFRSRKRTDGISGL